MQIRWARRRGAVPRAAIVVRPQSAATAAILHVQTPANRDGSAPDLPPPHPTGTSHVGQ